MKGTGFSPYVQAGIPFRFVILSGAESKDLQLLLDRKWHEF